MLNIPKEDSSKSNFNRHFIDEVVAELRFPKITSNLDKIEEKFKKDKDFQKNTSYALDSSFEFDFNINNSQNISEPEIKTTKKKVGIKITNTKELFHFEIKEDKFIFATNSYKRFKNFWDEVKVLIKYGEKFTGVNKYNWLGLRKKNKIKILTEKNIYSGEGLNKTLTGPISQRVFSGSSLKTISNSYFLSDDNIQCSFEFQVLKALSDCNYILQTNCDFNESFKEEKSFNEISKSAEELNKKHFNLFMWTFDDELKQAMRS